MKQQPEFQLQVEVCNYLNLQYPKVLFYSDTGSGAKLTPQQAYRNNLIKKIGYKNPDLFIIYANAKWHGLFLELKKETPYKKTGGLKKQLVSINKTVKGKIIKVGSYDHLELQEQSLKDLRLKGFMACFCWSFEMAKNTIDDYMKTI